MVAITGTDIAQGSRGRFDRPLRRTGTLMKSSTSLDAVVGLAFLFFAASFACSGIVEYVSKFFDKGGEYQLRGLREMLDVPPATPKAEQSYSSGFGSSTAAGGTTPTVGATPSVAPVEAKSLPSAAQTFRTVLALPSG